MLARPSSGYVHVFNYSENGWSPFRLNQPQKGYLNSPSEIMDFKLFVKAILVVNKQFGVLFWPIHSIGHELAKLDGFQPYDSLGVFSCMLV